MDTYSAIYLKPSCGDEAMMYKFPFNNMDSFLQAQLDAKGVVDRNEEDIGDFCDSIIIQDVGNKDMNEIDKLVYEAFGRTWSRRSPDKSWVYNGD